MWRPGAAYSWRQRQMILDFSMGSGAQPVWGSPSLPAAFPRSAPCARTFSLAPGRGKKGWRGVEGSKSNGPDAPSGRLASAFFEFTGPLVFSLEQPGIDRPGIAPGRYYG